MAEPDQFERPVAAEARQVTRGGIIHFEPRVGEADLVATQLDRGAFDHPAVDEQMAARESARGSEEHQSELQSLMRNSYALFCLEQKNTILTSSHKFETRMTLS